MASNRRLEALRAIAERPGTEAEGEIARELLKKLDEGTDFKAFRSYLRCEISLEELLAGLKPQPLTWEEQAVVTAEKLAADRRRLKLSAVAQKSECIAGNRDGSGQENDGRCASVVIEHRGEK